MSKSTWGKIQVELVDGRIWLFIRPLLITTRDGVAWEIPEGFRTDFASSKIGRWNTLPDHATYSPGAAFHDYCYLNDLVARSIADRYFFELLEDDGNSGWVCRKAYWGVRTFGWIAWRNHRRRNPNRNLTPS